MRNDLQMLQFKLQSILKNNSIKRTKLSTTGKIIPSRLAHYSTSNLLFSQPIPNTGKKYKCDFILDVSFSMYRGNKIVSAVKTLQELIRLFYGIIDFRITCFGVNSYNMSARDVLSIEAERLNDKEYFEKIFNRGVTIEYSQGKVVYNTRFEAKDIELSDGTSLTPVLGQVGENLKQENGERFIIFITDGYEQFQNIPKDIYICGVPVSYYNKSNHKEIAQKLISEGINILPIGIGINSLNEYYDNFIRTENGEGIYEPVLNFIETHFA